MAVAASSLKHVRPLLRRSASGGVCERRSGGEVLCGSGRSAIDAAHASGNAHTSGGESGSISGDAGVAETGSFDSGTLEAAAVEAALFGAVLFGAAVVQVRGAARGSRAIHCSPFGGRQGRPRSCSSSNARTCRSGNRASRSGSRREFASNQVNGSPVAPRMAAA
jgi:hypothetical protein